MREVLFFCYILLTRGYGYILCVNLIFARETIGITHYPISRHIVKFSIEKLSKIATINQNYSPPHPYMQQLNRTDDMLHGVTLAMILDYLVEKVGFEELGVLIRVNCFTMNPTKASSLKFLRKTEWARLQVQGLYVRLKNDEKYQGNKPIKTQSLT